MTKILSRATCFCFQSPPRSCQGPLLGARRSGHLYKRLEAGLFKKLDPAANVDHKSGQAGLEPAATDLTVPGRHRCDHGRLPQTLRPARVEPGIENILELSNTCSVVVVYMIMTEHIDPIPDDLPTQELLRTLLMRLHLISSDSSTSSWRLPRKCSVPYAAQGRTPRTEADALRAAP